MTNGIDNASDNVVRDSSSSPLETLDSLFATSSPEPVISDAPEAEEVTLPEESNDQSYQPQDENGVEALKAEIAKLKIKANGQEHEFELSADNEELREALEYGVAGKKSFSQANKLVADAKKRITELESKYANYNDVSSKAKTIDDISSLIENGHTEEAVRALLGEKYEDFKRNEIISTIDYENATPHERAEMDKERSDRDRVRTAEKTQQEISALKQQLADREDDIVVDRYAGLAENLLSKYSMSNFTDDAVRAEKLNAFVYKSVMNDMADFDVDQWTPRLMEKMFREQTSLIRGNIQKMTDDRVAQTIEAKKTEATGQAQMVASRNYTGNDSSKNDFVKDMGKASALDKLKMLANLR